MLINPTDTIPTPVIISDTTTLAELNRVKLAWINDARKLNYHENIWDVVFWLGQQAPERGGWKAKVWQSGRVAIIANEHSERYMPDTKSFLVKRSFTVWVDGAQLDKDRPASIDDIVFTSVPVARWSWYIAGSDKHDIESELLFVPGRWMAPIMADLVTAHQMASKSGIDISEFERRRMLAELLVGVEI